MKGEINSPFVWNETLSVRYSHMSLMCSRQLNTTWQSRIELEYYSVTYFERIIEFDALYSKAKAATDFQQDVAVTV